MNSTRWTLGLGTALGLVWFSADAQAQSATMPPASPPAVEDGVTLLETIDVGAGAEGTAGTDLKRFDAEELARKNPTDLADVFVGEPQIAVGGAIPSTQKIYVNGVDENNLAVTVDGSRQNNKVFHHNGTYLLDPALLKAVTLQAGVAPADAGPAALAGSIGFETKDAADLLLPGKDFGGFVTGFYDTNSGVAGTGLSLFGRVGGFEYLGYLNYANGGNFTAGNGQEMVGTGVDLLSGLGKIAYETETGHRFELSHEQVRDDDPRPYRANFYLNIGLEPVVRDYDMQRQNTVFTYTVTQPQGWFDPKIVLAYSRTELETPVFNRRTGALSAPTTGETASFNGKVENKFALDMGSVTTGFDFYSDKAGLEYPDIAFPEFPEEKSANVGFYAQARLEPFDNARLSFGARGDHQWFTGTDGSEFTNSGLSGNVSGEYDLVPDFLTAKAGYSHVWGGVPLAENFIQNPVWSYGPDGPEPVTSDNVTGGLKATYEGFFVEGNVFRSDIDGARLPTYSPAASGALRALDLETRGYEVGIGYEWESGFVQVKYADIDAEVDGVTADSEIGRYLTTPVGEIIMISGGYTHEPWGVRFGGDIEIGLPYNGTLVEHPSAPGEAKAGLPGYEVVNAYLEWTPPTHTSLTLRVDARNIFDETYTNRAAYGQDFLGVSPHLDPGRSFRLSATMRF